MALAVALPMLAVSQPASAVVHNLFANLDGLQETPPVATPGFGSATMTLDDVTFQFTLTGTFMDLDGTTTAAHVHGPAGFGDPAGVLFGITVDLGVSSGNISFDGVVDPASRKAPPGTLPDGRAGRRGCPESGHWEFSPSSMADFYKGIKN